MELDDLFQYWEEVRASLKRAVRSIDPETLNLPPQAGVNSVGDLLRLLLFNEDYWIWQIVMGEGCVLQADYNSETYPTVELIFHRMDKAWARTEHLLKSIPREELERVYVTPREEQMTLLTILWILFMEELHTRGQVFMLLQLLGHKPPGPERQ